MNIPYGHIFRIVTAIVVLAKTALYGENIRVGPIGPSESIVEHVTEIGQEQGPALLYTNRYTELGNGLNYLDGGVWKTTDTTLEVEPGFAKAWKGQHKVAFSADVNAGGSVAIELPDGGRLRSQIYGLAYVNQRTGESVLIASITNSQAWITEPNRIIYPNAFNEFAADVRYTYTRDGLEQDVILRESPPPPSEFGWDPADVHMEVWTEFNEDQSAKSARRNGRTRGKSSAGTTSGEDPVDLGTMEMAEGRAFQTGQEATTLARVERRWETVQGGRAFLVEAVPIIAVSAQLETLPQPANKDGASMRKRHGIQKFPNRLQAFKSIPRSVRRVGVEQALIPKIQSPEKLVALNAKPGLVLDYQLNLTANQTDYPFKGDTTYYVAGNYTISGIATLEGGAVIKFAQFVSGSVDPRINISGTLICKTSAYRPAVFTSKDDNSVGEVISGSSGAPTTSPYANYALRLTGTTSGYKVEHVRFCYTGSALSYANSYSNTVINAQFVKCLTPILNTGSGVVGAYNVLVDSVPTGGCVFNDGGVVNSFYGENMTIHAAANLRTSTSGTTLRLINSLVVNVTTVQSYTGNNNQQLSSASGIFQSALAGRFYLAPQSPYRNIGTTSIAPTLLDGLKYQTTYPPMLYSSSIGMGVTLYPQALRDNDLPDLGYHYQPLDYVWTRLSITNGTLTLAKGVAVGLYGPQGFLPGSGGNIVSVGLANSVNRLTTFHTVQEQPEAWITNTASFNLVGGVPKIGLRFTDVSFMSAGNGGRGFASASSHNETVDVKDSYLRGVYWKFYNYSGTGYFSPQHNIRNSFLDRSELDWEQGNWSISQIYYLSLSLRNNLFYNSKLILKRGSSAYGNWAIHDNLFSGVSPNISFFTGYTVIDTVGYNGATTGTSIPFSGTGDRTLLSSDFQTAALGSWYYPISGGASSLTTLINADTARTAASAGLFQHTTRSDYAKDGATASQLDIGFHYVATDSNGIPNDYDGDGLPDYIEDSNGNGTPDSGETNWQDSCNGTTGVSGLQIFTKFE